ncbi:MAG: hypothetical protein GYA14_08685 [Ignavibacteria bacterium]|nr:hypothetical protein [Ignavibacteria bacterium]
MDIKREIYGIISKTIMEECQFKSDIIEEKEPFFWRVNTKLIKKITDAIVLWLNEKELEQFMEQNSKK